MARGVDHARVDETGHVEGDCWTLTEQAVRTWFSNARPGDQLIYAKGSRLLRTAGVELISGLGDRGHLRFNFNRSGDGRGQYLATRLAVEAPAPVVERRFTLSARVLDAAPDDLQRLMRVLRRVANMGDPCPSNSDLARLAELRDKDQAAYLMRKAISAKFIRVETATDNQRIVTIVSSGRKTARVLAQGCRQ